MTLCTDNAVKYTGCHFEQIAAAMAHAPLDCDLKPNVALANNDSTAATIHEMRIGRKMLPLGPKYPSMHSERNTPFKRAWRHAQQKAVNEDAAKRISMDRIMKCLKKGGAIRSGTYKLEMQSLNLALGISCTRSTSNQGQNESLNELISMI